MPWDIYFGSKGHWERSHHQVKKGRERDGRRQARQQKALRNASLAFGGSLEDPTATEVDAAEDFYTTSESASSANLTADEIERRRVLPHVRFIALPKDCPLTLDEANIYNDEEDL